MPSRFRAMARARAGPLQCPVLSVSELAQAARWKGRARAPAPVMLPIPPRPPTASLPVPSRSCPSVTVFSPRAPNDGPALGDCGDADASRCQPSHCCGRPYTRAARMRSHQWFSTYSPTADRLSQRFLALLPVRPLFFSPPPKRRKQSRAASGALCAARAPSQQPAQCAAARG